MHSTLEPANVDHLDAANDPDVALALLAIATRRLESIARVGGCSRRSQYHRAISIVHDICQALIDCETAGASDADIRRVVEPARAIHGESPFVTRLQRWPRGYPGDFETIEWLCRGDNHAPGGTLAHAIETYALTAAIAQQHRNKVSMQATYMLQAFAQGRSCRVLSLGCGSSPDLRSIVSQVPACARLVLCDSDADALTFSRDRLAAIGDRCHFVHGFVPRVLRRVTDLGPFNLIMAGGLFDYLSDRFIVRTLRDAWQLLAPGGRIVFTNIASENPYRVWIEYLGDWKLIERSEADIAALCRTAGVPMPELTRDATSLAIIATLTRTM